jgi:hypothetical protein
VKGHGESYPIFWRQIGQCLEAEDGPHAPSRVDDGIVQADLRRASAVYAVTSSTLGTTTRNELSHVQDSRRGDAPELKWEKRMFFWFAMNGGGTHHGTVVKTRSADAESAVSFENIPLISRRAACSR